MCSITGLLQSCCERLSAGNVICNAKDGVVRHSYPLKPQHHIRDSRLAQAFIRFYTGRMRRAESPAQHTRRRGWKRVKNCKIEQRISPKRLRSIENVSAYLLGTAGAVPAFGIAAGSSSAVQPVLHNSIIAV